MYNRYIPQSDGTYRRNRIPDPSAPHHTRPTPSPPSPQKPDVPQPPPCPPPQPCSGPVKHGSIGGFLRQLLPKDMDTGDLLIILLLLLMAGDCEEEKGSALLTLALYLLM